MNSVDSFSLNQAFQQLYKLSTQTLNPTSLIKSVFNVSPYQTLNSQRPPVNHSPISKMHLSNYTSGHSYYKPQSASNKRPSARSMHNSLYKHLHSSRSSLTEQALKKVKDRENSAQVHKLIEPFKV